MDSRRRAARDWLFGAEALSAAMMLTGCMATAPVEEEPIPAEVAITPEVEPPPEPVQAEVMDPLGPNLPLPRMKPAVPKNQIARLAANKAREGAKPSPSGDSSTDDASGDDGGESESVAPGELVGSDFSSVLEVLRDPDAVQESSLSVVWTYSDSDCTVLLYFYPDIQTTTFHLLKYDIRGAAGERLDDSRVCMKHLVR